jgi:A/G-specific adenine glycosylase
LDPIAKDLLKWYDLERRVLPWREHPSPYRTWVSEVMLQQTRVDTVLPYFERFMARFPTVEDLASAELDEVLGLWSGLGYYSRARNMHRTAKLVRDKGLFPFDISGLRQLPGIGEYMAAAIASIALGQDVATVDGNIARVMSRLHADASPRKSMWAHARAHLPAGRAGDYNQALMDLGARICLSRGPLCQECPISAHCQALEANQVSKFPPPKKKRAVPTVRLACIVVPNSTGFWFGRRPPEGLWGGLWELPTVDLPPSANDVVEYASRWFQGPVRPLGQIRHILTHRVIELHVLIAAHTDTLGPFHYKQFRGFCPEGLANVGTSALTKKALELAQSETSSN